MKNKVLIEWDASKILGFIVVYTSYHRPVMGNLYWLTVKNNELMIDEKWWLMLFLCVLDRLRPLDLQVLKKLHDIVNVIPVIAKADSLTVEVSNAAVIMCLLISRIYLSTCNVQERLSFRKQIQQDLLQHRIGIYPMAKYEHGDDTLMNQTYRVRCMFII